MVQLAAGFTKLILHIDNNKSGRFRI